MNAKATGNLIALSVQEMLDCSSNYKNLYGCKGGDICTALGWLIEVIQLNPFIQDTDK